MLAGGSQRHLDTPSICFRCQMALMLRSHVGTVQ